MSSSSSFLFGSSLPSKSELLSSSSLELAGLDSSENFLLVAGFLDFSFSNVRLSFPFKMI